MKQILNVIIFAHPFWKLVNMVHSAQVNENKMQFQMNAKVFIQKYLSAYKSLLLFLAPAYDYVEDLQMNFLCLLAMTMLLIVSTEYASLNLKNIFTAAWASLAA